MHQTPEPVDRRIAPPGITLGGIRALTSSWWWRLTANLAAALDRWLRLRAWSIGARLAAVVIALAVPLNLLIALAIWQLAGVAAETQRTALLYTARTVAGAVDAQLGTYMGLAQSLANSPALQAKDLRVFAVEARRAFASIQDAWVLVADLDGQQLLNTALNERTLPRRSSHAIVAQQQALAQRKLLVSDRIWEGPGVKRLITTIEVPIFKDGQPFRALAIVMTLEGFQRLLIGQKTPAGWLTGIIDRDGRFLARVPDHERYVGQLASEGWRNIIGEEGLFEFNSLEGKRIVQGNSHPSNVAWTVGIAAEQKQLQASTWRAVRWTIIPGMALSALSLLFALFVARRVTGPIAELRSKVPALMQGRAIEIDAASPELNELAAALRSAGIERKQAEDTSLQLAAIVRSSFDAIISKTLQGVITSWNSSAETMFGYSAEEAVGKNVRMLIPADRQQEEDAILRKLAENQRVEPFETVRVRKDGQAIPVSITISPITDALGVVVGASKIARDISDRKAKEEQVQVLLRELSHRSKNLLSVVQAIANRTGAHLAPEFVGRFNQRLHALAVNQDLLAHNEWHGVLIEDLVKAQLEPFAGDAKLRIRTEGPVANITASAAQSIGMALHELATNASKYGALSDTNGEVSVRWALSRDSFEMTWMEKDGPPVKKPTRDGFGSLVISAMVEQSLDGSVELDYAPTGLIWRLSCPAQSVLESKTD